MSSQFAATVVISAAYDVLYVQKVKSELITLSEEIMRPVVTHYVP